MDFSRGLIDRTKELLGFKTQTELAEHFGVTRKQVSEWRNGNATPPYSKFLKIAKEHNINLNWFFFGIGEKYLSDKELLQVQDKNEKKFFIYESDLTDQEKELINTIMDCMPYTPRAFFDKIVERFKGYKNQFKELSSLE